jgi:hypothetical protein
VLAAVGFGTDQIWPHSEQQKYTATCVRMATVNRLDGHFRHEEGDGRRCFRRSCPLC